MTRSQFQRVEISRKGELVLLAFKCRDEYAAMLMYDDMERHLRDGYLQVEVEPGDAETRSSDG